jgi:hypothetical protein
LASQSESQLELAAEVLKSHDDEIAPEDPNKLPDYVYLALAILPEVLDETLGLLE